MIYYYYVRYTIFDKKEHLIGYGCTEIMIDYTISTFEDIKQIISLIKHGIKNGEKKNIIIDFFTLLRTEAKENK